MSFSTLKRKPFFYCCHVPFAAKCFPKGKALSCVIVSDIFVKSGNEGLQESKCLGFSKEIYNRRHIHCFRPAPPRYAFLPFGRIKPTKILGGHVGKTYLLSVGYASGES